MIIQFPCDFHDSKLRRILPSATRLLICHSSKRRLEACFPALSLFFPSALPAHPFNDVYRAWRSCRINVVLILRLTFSVIRTIGPFGRPWLPLRKWRILRIFCLQLRILSSRRRRNGKVGYIWPKLLPFSRTGDKQTCAGKSRTVLVHSLTVIGSLIFLTDVLHYT